ncbi:hypothetical protein [Thermococcus sp. 9N3]|uniref:hypothetical protein n=1 Tax=Thermococcus sp. 9N3 TaxID=163002 RepID=UPI0014317307|nr:hypothetical protein [Thermococcus sp. 9N3]
MVDHNTLGYLSFALMTLALVTGPLYFLSPRWKRVLLYFHVILGLLAYIAMFLAIWLVR